MKISWVRGDHDWAFRYITDALAKAMPEHQHVFNEYQGADVFFVVEPACFSLISPALWGKCVLHLDSDRVMERGIDYTAVLKNCKAIIAGSEKLRALALTYNQNTHLIPNGLELEEWKPTVRPRVFTPGFCGSLQSPRHREYKGIDFAFEGCRKAGLQLFIATNGQNQIPHGQMRAKFWSQISCLVHPTRGEGSSGTIMEALASGVPVITTREAGYHGEMLTDKENVLFVEREPESIANALRSLITNDRLRTGLAQEGIRFAQENHSIKDVARDCLQVFSGEKAVEPPKVFTREEARSYKPRILAFVDDKRWCYYTTAQEIIKRTRDDFEYRLISHQELRKAAGFKFDLVWGRGYYHLMLPLLNCYGGANKAIYTITTGGELLPERLARNHPVDKEAIGIITQCPGTRKAVEQKWNGTRLIWEIPNGVDTERFRPALDKPAGFVIGYSGRTAGNSRHQKGIEYVTGLQIRSGMSVKVADKQAMIPHAEMPGFYQALSCYVQPSLSEGCSNSVMEAMACGLPCLILKGVGYHGETCTDDEVVFVERTRESISAAIDRLKNEPDYAARIGAGARAFALKHSWDIISERYRAILWEALRVSAGREIEVPISGGAWINVQATDAFRYNTERRPGDVFPLRQKHIPFFSSHVKILDPSEYKVMKSPLQELFDNRQSDVIV